MTVADLSLMWITTRAAGVAALLASTASVVLGLALAGRLSTGRRGFLGDAKVLHQTLGIATMVALLVHAGSLLLDPWLTPTFGQIAVPFALDYRPFWTGIGVIAGYGIVVFGLSGFLKSRLGPRWKVVHRFAGLAWAASVIHVLGAGSDVGTLWMTIVLACCVAPVVALTAVRLHQSGHLGTRNERVAGGTPKTRVQT